MAQPRKTTKSKLQPGNRIVSFQMETDTIEKSQKSAFDRLIPWSMWMREAAREKLQREANGATA